MLTLFHAPNSRSTRTVALLKELDALDQVQIDIVSIRRQDGTGQADPQNPHPEGKVPYLVQDGVGIGESIAIFQHLADLFPERELNIPQGDPQRGAYLGWFAWYAGVMEPVIILDTVKVSHPALQYTFRGNAEIHARLEAALTQNDYLLGDRFTAVDLLLASPYAWFGKPGVPVIDAWVDRCTARPGTRFAAEFDQLQMKLAEAA